MGGLLDICKHALHVQVGDAGVCELRCLSRLQRLGLAGCAGIGNGALGAVAAMTALRELSLEWCSVGDKGAR